MLRWSTLLVAMLYPTLAAWIYFDLLAGTAALAPTYVASKLLQAALPLAAWRWTSVRRHDARSRAGVLPGVLFGAAAAIAVFGAHRILADTPLLAGAAGRIADRLAAFGAAGPLGFVLLALLLSVVHSLFEEYYWRWFLYPGLADEIGAGGGILVSGLAFASHHVIVVRQLLGAPVWLAFSMALAVAVAGWFWAWLFERSGSLPAVWVSHAVVDGGLMLVGYEVLWG